MRFSPSFKSSPQCIVSHDGLLVATLSSPTSIIIRSTTTLQTANAVKLTAEVSGPILTLLWSPSSTNILASTADHIFVSSALNQSFKATIQNPSSSAGKPSAIFFGQRDTDVLVFAAFGLKLVIFDLSRSEAVEISSPKFHQPTTASRGFSIHPQTGHVALMTRIGGSDTVSIHHPVTRQLERSWKPETTDAHTMTWSPDGKWLVLWDSPAHGRRLCLYTPDGQPFRSFDGSFDKPLDEEAKLDLGFKLCQFSPDGTKCVVADHSRAVTIFDTDLWRQDAVLRHPNTIDPHDTLQVWQEQLHDGLAHSSLTRNFLRATQAISPTTSTETKLATDIKQGCSAGSLDASSTLLATKLDDSPGTLWIWDIVALELRAVLLFHSNVDFSWHPHVRELLLIKCQEDGQQRMQPFVWDPLSEGPAIVSVDDRLPPSKLAGKLQATWLGSDQGTPSLLLSDSQTYCLLSLTDTDSGSLRWQTPNASDAGQRTARKTTSPLQDEDDYPQDLEDDTSVLEDTFCFKHG